jgi:hypothetical protein
MGMALLSLFLWFSVTILMAAVVQPVAKCANLVGGSPDRVSCCSQFPFKPVKIFHNSVPVVVGNGKLLDVAGVTMNKPRR